MGVEPTVLTLPWSPSLGVIILRVHPRRHPLLCLWWAVLTGVWCASTPVVRAPGFIAPSFIHPPLCYLSSSALAFISSALRSSAFCISRATAVNPASQS